MFPAFEAAGLWNNKKDADDDKVTTALDMVFDSALGLASWIGMERNDLRHDGLLETPHARTRLVATGSAIKRRPFNCLF